MTASTAPATRRAIIYSRVSTIGQATAGHGLDAQQAQCAAYCSGLGIAAAGSFTDAGVSGSVAPGDRAGMSAALQMLRQGQADTLVVASLSRIGRKVRDVLAFVEDELVQKGFHLIILDCQVDTRTAGGMVTLRIMACIDQFERDQIAERTRQGLAAARAKGVRLGAPVSEASRVAGRRVLALRKKGVTWRAIGPRLEEEGYRTATGNTRWGLSQVQQVARSVQLDRQATIRAAAR